VRSPSRCRARLESALHPFGMIEKDLARLIAGTISLSWSQVDEAIKGSRFRLATTKKSKNLQIRQSAFWDFGDCDFLAT
jgi:hypothetical protein